MRYKSITILISGFMLLVVSCSSETSIENPFEAYLSVPHPSYQYELESVIEGDSHKTYVISLISQEWSPGEHVREPVWKHWLTVVVPDEVSHETALLMIGSGTKDDELPENPHPIILEAALATNSITAHIHNVPSQPITFIGDEYGPRSEDEIIAYGWRQFLEGGADNDDAIWLGRLPMTASAMRAMDTVTDFADAELGLAINNYVLTGASKRGWTTWTTAIFDDRVIAIAPAVIDLLNVDPSFKHHWRVYGEWSPAIRDYEEETVMSWQESSEYDRLIEILDPFSYLGSLRMPKYLINAASDEFFLPDSWQFYWDDLPGEKYLRYIPNTGHNLSGTGMETGLISFYNHILNGRDLPDFDWTVNPQQIEVSYSQENPPDRLRLWNAHNPESRDFRLYVIDRIWMARDLTVEEDGDVSVDLQQPESGYTAWFVEAIYDAESEYPFTETTGVVVTPDTYPYEPFEADPPLGTIEYTPESDE